MAIPKRLTRRPPRGIVLLACVLAAGGILFVVGAGALLLANPLAIYRSALAQAGVAQDTQIGTGLLALAGGIVLITLAVGLLRLQRWAWGLGVLVLGADIGVIAIVIHNGAILAPDQLATAGSAALMLLYLLAPGVIGAFFRPSPRPSAHTSPEPAALTPAARPRDSRGRGQRSATA